MLFGDWQEQSLLMIAFTVDSPFSPYWLRLFDYWLLNSRLFSLNYACQDYGLEDLWLLRSRQTIPVLFLLSGHCERQAQEILHVRILS